MEQTHFDVLVVGAGLSGICMGCYLTRECPDKSFAILERRQAIGGTWDLFRYPGIRSDSDMMTFGYDFRPWTDTNIFADGPSIRAYIRESAEEYGVDKKVRFGSRIERAEWSSEDERWTVTIARDDQDAPEILTCKFLVGAFGYYNHDEGYQPHFPGVEDFEGHFIHPQHWPEDLNYAGKKVVVIGSGATALTLIPAMADQTAELTMLQRSPSYVFSMPSVDYISALLARVMPMRWVYRLGRARNIFLHRAIFKLSRRFPRMMRGFFLKVARLGLGRDYDLSHFTPSYMPWDERLCMVPDGDLFKTIRSGKASVVTDHIDRITPKGIRLTSGKALEADIIISATGLTLGHMGGMQASVDGAQVKMTDRMTYKGVLVQDLPNFAVLFGYTNISWTLKAEMAAQYVCRLLNEMDARGAHVVTPRAPSGQRTDASVMDALESGYVKRGGDALPKQGREAPWRVMHHFEKDRAMYRAGVEDPALEWAGS